MKKKLQDVVAGDYVYLVRENYIDKVSVKRVTKKYIVIRKLFYDFRFSRITGKLLKHNYCGYVDFNEITLNAKVGLRYDVVDKLEYIAGEIQEFLYIADIDEISVKKLKEFKKVSKEIIKTIDTFNEAHNGKN